MINNHPKITIAIITYNREHFLPEAISSALKQEVLPYEILIVNDASTDGTEPYLRQLNYPQIKVIHNSTNEGRATARNTAIQNFTGDFLLWLDDDDVLEPNAIKQHLQTLLQNPKAEILYGNLLQCDATLTPQKELIYNSYAPPEIIANLLLEDVFPQGGTMIKRSVFEKVGRYDPKKFRSEDYDFWARAAMRHCVFAHTNSVIYRFRFHQNNLSNPENIRYQSKFQCEIIEDILKQYPLEQIFPKLDWTNGPNESAAAAMSIIGRIFFNHGDDGRALDCFCQAENFFPSIKTSAMKGLTLRSMQHPSEAAEELAHALAATYPDLQSMVVEIGAPRGSEAIANRALATNNTALPVVIFHKDQLLDPIGVNGGAETATLALARALAKQNQRVYLAAYLPSYFLETLDGNSVKHSDGITYIDFGETFYTGKVFNIIDTVYHLEKYNLITVSRVQALLESRDNPKIKNRFFLTHEPATGAFGANLQVISKVVDKIIAVSEPQKQNLVEAGAEKDKIVTIPNGVDHEIFKSGEWEHRDYNKIVFAGALVVDKGLHLLIEAFINLKQQHPLLSLDIYGTAGMWGRKDYINIDEVKKLPNITLHGAVSQIELAKAYATAGLVVLPSIYFDSFNMACAEAQVCGAPVIGSYYSGMRDIIEDGLTGLLLKEITAATLAQNINNLLVDSTKLKAMSACALQSIRPKFSWNITAANFIELFAKNI